MPGPEIQDDDKYNIHAQILKKYGQDFSPEARAAVEAKANQQKNSFGVVGGGLLSALGNVIGGNKPDFSPLEKRRAQIDAETTGEFDKKREQAVKDYLLGNAMEDRGFKNKVAETTFGDSQTDRTREKGFEAQSDDPNSPESQELQNFYMEVRKTDNLGGVNIHKIPATQLRPLLDQAIKMRQATRPAAMGGYGPDDAAVLQAGARIAQGLVPVTEDVDLSKASPKASQQFGTLAGAARGRENTQQRFKTLRGKDLADLRNIAGVLAQTDAIGEGLPGWDTGFVKNRADMLKWYGGWDDPTKAKIRSQLGLNLAEYIKSISGTAVNPDERKFLTSVTPNADDDEDTLFAKLETFRDYNETKLNNFLNVTGDVGQYNVPSFEEMRPKSAKAGAAPAKTEPEAKKVVHKQYSKSANKTKLFYSDGTEEIVDGQQ